jgi:hypothetical protein
MLMPGPVCRVADFLAVVAPQTEPTVLQITNAGRNVSALICRNSRQRNQCGSAIPRISHATVRLALAGALTLPRGETQRWPDA